ncbi:hypothetical protein QT231_11670 [Halomonas sp. SpR1]|uniref:hypothetical protein n=1 Tax=Halomonas sp. SpR1 TaxID=3050462 RepID=UPI0027E5537D|nr:hypothetical protein [Halomonas sp. SpR1]MDQ7733359.1 hypothetical protein [Halomonas sp. SpR1]
MRLHLSNLDELIQNVRNVHAKNYLNEAIAAYRTGAYRASLIATWIAVCVDIIEKIRELSLSEDSAAKKWEQQLDKIRPDDPRAMLDFERNLLNIACDELQLISMIEKSHLERLRDDRNICAHPTFSDDGSQFSPPAELALAYIVQSANYLLVHPPVKGKVIVQRMYELINEPSFPESEEKAFTLLSSENNLGRVKDSGVRNLAIIILKRIFRDETGISQELLNRLSASLSVIQRMYPAVYEEVVSNILVDMLSEANDTRLKRIFPFLNLRSELWDKLEHAERIRIEGLINAMDSDDISRYQVARLVDLNVEIRSQIFEKIDSLSNVEMAEVIAAYPSVFFKDKSIYLFAESLSFNSAEFRGNQLLLPISSTFNDRDLKDVFKGALENTGSHGINQVLNAGAIGTFFSSLYTETKAAPVNHRVLWIDFWERISGRGFSYNTLREKLIADQYIAPKEEDEESEDEMPF